MPKDWPTVVDWGMRPGVPYPSIRPVDITHYWGVERRDGLWKQILGGNTWRANSKSMQPSANMGKLVARNASEQCRNGNAWSNRLAVRSPCRSADT